MNALRSWRELTSEISMFDTGEEIYNVILIPQSREKNLGSFLQRLPTEIDRDVSFRST